MRSRWAFAAACLLFASQASAQANWEASARQADEAYWAAYNQADPEFAVGRADFTQLMLLQGKAWKITRIFSYEHVNAPGK